MESTQEHPMILQERERERERKKPKLIHITHQAPVALTLPNISLDFRDKDAAPFDPDLLEEFSCRPQHDPGLSPEEEEEEDLGSAPLSGGGLGMAGMGMAGMGGIPGIGGMGGAGGGMGEVGLSPDLSLAQYQEIYPHSSSSISSSDTSSPPSSSAAPPQFFLRGNQPSPLISAGPLYLTSSSSSSSSSAHASTAAAAAVNPQEHEAKYQAVVESLQAGKSYSVISKETGVPKSTVGSIKRRWLTKGNLDDGRKHNGRPPKLTPKQLKKIEKILEETHGTMSSTDILNRLKFDVSARTIRRAKRGIMERRSQERRSSIIMAVRSLAASAASSSAPSPSTSGMATSPPASPSPPLPESPEINRESQFTEIEGEDVLAPQAWLPRPDFGQ